MPPSDHAAAPDPRRPHEGMRRLLVGAAVFAMLLVGLPVDAPIAVASDTVQAFTESPGCEALDGTKGPLMGPGPAVGWFNYASLPNSTEVLGPWGDYFGRTIGEIRDSLVVVNLPGQPKDLYIHERVLPAFNQAIANMEAYAPEGESYEIRSDTWSFNPAVIPGGRHLSFHGIGAALDINSTTNPYSSDPNNWTTDMPEWFVQAWKDAGWCWGGDWVSIKDPMHFAWMGPVHADFAEAAPYPADTSAAGFDTTTPVTTRFDAGFETAARLALDINRDGAPDILRVHESSETGAFRIEIAESWRDFETCASTNWSGLPALTRSELAAGDYDADGRPELWLIDETGIDVRVAIYTMVNRDGGFTTIEGTPTHVDTLTTGADPAAGGAYFVGDHDRDGYGDLYVVVPGATTTLQIWGGPDLTTALVNRTIDVDSTGEWRFGLGDFDLDAIPDLYALSPDAPASLEVVTGGSGFAGAASTIATGVTPVAGETLAVEDFDGDGRDDLYLIDEIGDARVVLGGERADGSDLTEWFVERDFSWTPGIGCLVPPPVTEILDPGFESGAKADSPHGFAESGGGAWAITAGAARTGGYGGRFNATGQTAIASLEINGAPGDGSTHVHLTEGQAIGYSVWVKSEGTADPNRVRPRIDFYDADGRYLDGVAHVVTNPTSDWARVDVAGIAPPGTAFAAFEIRVHPDGGGGFYLFDDLALIGPLAPVDSITDPGFESGTLDAHGTTSGGGTWSITDAAARSGEHSAAFDAASQDSLAILWANGDRADAISHVPVSAGQVVGFSAWVRSSEGATNRMRPRIHFYDNAGRWLGGDTPGIVTPGADWQQLVVAGVAPANSAYAILQVRVHEDGAGGMYSVDDLGLYAPVAMAGTIQNPGFETGSLAPHAITGTGGTFTVEADASRSGSRGLSFAPAGQTEMAIIWLNGGRRSPEHIAVAAGDPVGFTAWVAAATASPANRVRPRIHFYDADWNYLDGVTMNVVSPTTAWTQVTAAGIAPAGAAIAVFQLRVHDDGHDTVILIDDLAPAG